MNATKAPQWEQTDDGVATVGVDGFHGRIDLADPAAGIGGPAHEGALLGVRVADSAGPGALEEVYTRGADLIATHAAADDWPFRTQLAWSVEPGTSPGVVLATLTLSLQTDLLDTRPKVDVVVSCASGWRCGATADGRRCAWSHDADTSRFVLVAPHASDLTEAALMATPADCRVRLTPPMLEKGVIRRCRVAAVLVESAPVDAARTAASETFEAFLRRPLPLTA